MNIISNITSRKMICVICAALLSVLAVLSGCADKDDETSSVTSTSAETESDAEPVVTTGTKIYVNDSSLGEIWLTELEGVAVNTLSDSGFSADSTFKYYSEDGKPASLEGVDVSEFNGDIDWEKVAAAGVDFAMIRIGGRNYGDGELYSDTKAIENIEEAKAAGISVGVYFFSQATTDAEAMEEANYVIELLDGEKLDFPVAYDWEIVKDDDARTDDVSSDQATSNARVFCDTISAAGYTPMIYSPSQELYFKYDLQQLTDIDIWYCEYADVPSFYYQFSMWQYSCTAEVDGIDGTTDLNICFTSIAEYD